MNIDSSDSSTNNRKNRPGISTTLPSSSSMSKYNDDGHSVNSSGSNTTKESTERLKQQNSHLSSEVQELRLELAYYKGEVKRLEWDNHCLTKEVDKLSAIFNGWLTTSSRGNVVDNPYHLSTIIKLPPKHISELMKCKQEQFILLTSCQPPFHIEYVNKAWSDFCGWSNDDILGSSCGFLQGNETDMEIISAFTNDLKQTAYARMRIHNYDKDNNLFASTVTVFPVYDSIAHYGPDSDIPVLTHLCAVTSDVEYINKAQDKQIPSFDQYDDDCIHLAESKGIPLISAHRLHKATKFSGTCSMDIPTFLSFAANIRLSDLLRFMITCESPLFLLDENDSIIHTNKPWCDLFGYHLNEIEGQNKSVIFGSLTSVDERCHSRNMDNLPKTVYYYDKNANPILCNTGMVSIIGGYLNPSITHFCTMFLPINNTPLELKADFKSNNIYQSNQFDDASEMQISEK